MTSKNCKVCGTYIAVGRCCPECGQQLYPDVGKTIWLQTLDGTIKRGTICEKPKFDVWSGEKIEEEKK